MADDLGAGIARHAQESFIDLHPLSRIQVGDAAGNGAGVEGGGKKRFAVAQRFCGPLAFGDVPHRRMEGHLSGQLHPAEEHGGEKLPAADPPVPPLEKVGAFAQRRRDHLPGFLGGIASVRLPLGRQLPRPVGDKLLLVLRPEHRHGGRVPGGEPPGRGRQGHEGVAGSFEEPAVFLLARLQRLLLGSNADIGAAEQDIDEAQQQRQKHPASRPAQDQQARKGRLFGADVAQDQQVADLLARDIRQGCRGDPPHFPAGNDLPVRLAVDVRARQLVGPWRKGVGQAALRGVDHHAPGQAVPVGLPPEQAHAGFPAPPAQKILADDHGQLDAGPGFQGPQHILDLLAQLHIADEPAAFENRLYHPQGEGAHRPQIDA